VEELLQAACGVMVQVWNYECNVKRGVKNSSGIWV